MSGIPSQKQINWHDNEIGMFIHGGPNVYQNTQGDNLSTPLENINPKLLDTDQWAKVAHDMGAKYVVLVTKHVGGFCTWQTDTTPYSIKNTPWRDGKGDIVGDLSKSLKKYGLKLGVYVSPMDKFNGVKASGIALDPAKQEWYDGIFRQQLKELLTNYGDVEEVWFDGSTVCDVSEIVRDYGSNAVIFQSKFSSIRWVGNEDGFAHYPAWNSLMQEDAAGGHSTQEHSNPDGDTWLPLECDTTMRSDWFWSPDNADTLKSVDELLNIYYNTVGNGAVLLLNANPDDNGVIPEADAIRAKEFGDELIRRFKKPIAETCGTGLEYILTFEVPSEIDNIHIMEDIQYGERVREFDVKGLCDSGWVTIFDGTAIGHRKIHRFQPITVKELMLTVKKSSDTPHIRSFAAFNVGEPRK